MSEEESHTDGIPQGLFCAVRADTCDCGNKYYENCKPGWAYIKYPQRYTKTITYGAQSVQRLQSNRRSFEAHHLVCIASLTKIIGKNEVIIPVVRQTKWCVNHKKNMIALPMWCHTLRWYCSMITGAVRDLTLNDGSKVSVLGAPPFKDLPQHDYDHDLYLDEVDVELNKIADSVAKNKQSHKHRKKELKAALNKLVGICRGKLRERGTRKHGGTHQAWRAGLDKQSDWYLCFSMAVTGDVKPRSFPASGAAGSGYMAEKIQSMVDAFWAGV